MVQKLTLTTPRMPDRPLVPGSPVKAIVLGLVIDVAGTLAAALVMTTAYAAYMASSGATPEQFLAAPLPSWLSIACLVIGTAFSVTGGYVCARTAKHSEFKFGAILAVLSTAFGVLFGASGYSLWLHIVVALITFAAVMFGTRLGAIRNSPA